ncbi:hypothetical protein [Paenibacillus ferrarius]|uniref:hypothetical protein n=1 Tax=Paenibacillus ferrarius TaxID=1469647 RepID=UPI003D2B7838
MASNKEKSEPTFTKAQFLKAKSFTGLQKDIMRAILDSEEAYTFDQVNVKIDEFMRKDVQQ